MACLKESARPLDQLYSVNLAGAGGLTRHGAIPYKHQPFDRWRRKDSWAPADDAKTGPLSLIWKRATLLMVEPKKPSRKGQRISGFTIDGGCEWAIGS